MGLSRRIRLLLAPVRQRIQSYPVNPDSKMAEEEVDIDLADPEVGKAASKIQSCFKARMARKSPKEAPKETPTPPPPEKEEVEEKEAEEEVVDIDLEDPEVNEAAKKMQACFKARKKTV